MDGSDIKFAARDDLEQTIEEQRAHLLQAHGVLICLYEVLLYAEWNDALNYAQAAHAAASLIDRSVENLDSARIKPLLDALTFGSSLPIEEGHTSSLR